ncbi:MAG TPA: isoprenyl transferase [Saprospiraceae bacterium]|nr:isoprenyl transferase [Saprospiraceae bacterium]HMV22765.1 isoprenyl transferase [Saprospiraceae bacterium]HMW75208.1 isoprenyl transferase [Saprospiraceae bacterium]HMX83116.1 isoprenyl transferase [Saprospiraceae bacterium]HMX85447.1 isoprenyl transferase [Saprospiraceae bacterium]
MKELKSQIVSNNIPVHVAVVMDGNGRWAKQHGKPRVFGHKNGVKSIRDVSEAAAELGIKYLTLYAFSTENWNRPALEVNALMTLLVETIRKEVATLNKNNIRLQAIGDISRLPEKSRKALAKAIEDTAQNNMMTMVLALNYSSKWELTKAVIDIAKQVKENKLDLGSIDESVITRHLATKDIPDPELLIRTSGELRLSNFLLWQLAYSELYFTDTYWPDFNKEEFFKAIISYQSRERRFGKTSEQLISNTSNIN